MMKKCATRVFLAIAWLQATMTNKGKNAILLFRGGGRFLHSLGQPLHLVAV
jgi:hypothetical protein